MDATNNIATDLFYKVRSRFQGLKLGAETGQITINPEDARFFDFDYTEDGNAIGHVSISLAEPNSMKVYFSTGITEGMDDGQKDGWYKFLRELRSFAKRRLLAFDTRDIAKDNLDKRDYEFLSQHARPQPADKNQIVKPVGENIMSESNLYGTKTMSYQKLMDTRLIIKHSKTVMDDMAPGARSRNIAALFVENQDGERFKYPFIHLAGARAMQRHVANGGLPYDAVGESIIKMSEEIAQLKSFSNYVVRNDLMNSDTNEVVMRGQTRLDSLRETVAKIAKQSHYEAYVENFQATEQPEISDEMMEDFKEKFTVKKFNEEMADVFPVLYRLMQEENTVGYDDIVGNLKNEELEEDFDETKDDDFATFENWVMNLGEESPIQSSDLEEQQTAIKSLQALVGESFPAGVDGTNAIESLEGIIDDPRLEQKIKEAAKEDANADVRPMVKQWIEENAPEALEELDFGDIATEEEFVNDELWGQFVETLGDEGTELSELSWDDVKKRYSDFYGGLGKHFGDKISAAGDDIAKAMPKTTRQLKWIGKTAGSAADAAGDAISKGIDAAKPYASAAADAAGDLANKGFDKLKKYFNEPSSSANTSEPSEPSSSDKDEFKKKFAGAKPDWIGPGKGVASKTNAFSKPDWQGPGKGPATEGSDGVGSVQELAEFIFSFYDRNTGTFPKGPEGVCTMVGKKFGEQAEAIARKMVERMAPVQDQGAEYVEASAQQENGAKPFDPKDPSTHGVEGKDWVSPKDLEPDDSGDVEPEDSWRPLMKDPKANEDLELERIKSLIKF